MLKFYFMRNKILLLGLVITCSLQTFARAQIRSTIQVNTGGYYIFGYDRFEGPKSAPPTGLQGNYKSAVALLGLQYQYRFCKNLHAFANYSMASNQPDFISSKSGFGRFATYRHDMTMLLGLTDGRFEDAEGLLISRNNYHFFDAGLGYQYSFSGRHHLKGSFGLSYAYGYNVYLTKLIVSPYPDQAWSEVIPETAYRGEHVGYWGAVAGISYDYSFWENRLNAGTDAHFRYYESDMPFFMNYGLHVGFNF